MCTNICSMDKKWIEFYLKCSFFLGKNGKQLNACDGWRRLNSWNENENYVKVQRKLKRAKHTRGVWHAFKSDHVTSA